MKSVYLAGQIQHKGDNGVTWRNYVKNHYDSFEWLDPLDEYNNTEKAVEEEWSNTEIVSKDLEMIDESDALLVNWSNVPTCGTPMEMFYAADQNIPVVVRTDVDLPDLSPWLEVYSSRISSTYNYAIECLEEEL